MQARPLSWPERAMPGACRTAFGRRRKSRNRALVEIQWSASGQHLMGAPVVATAPLRDARGALITDEDQDGNQLKSAIPARTQECSILYAGNGAH